MLIVLNDSVGNLDPALSNDDAEGIENALRAFANGVHLLYASRVTLEKLNALNYFERRQSAALRKLIVNYSDVAGIARLGLARLELVLGAGAMTRVGPRHVQLSPAALAIGQVLESAIVAENLLDCELYEHAANQYRLEQRLLNLRVKSHFRPGGGSQIPLVFESILGERAYPAICITDGDRWCTQEGASHATSECEKLADSASWPCEHYELMERELENILPSNIVWDAVAGEARVRLEGFECLVHRAGSDVGAFADMREGVALGKVLEMSQHSPRRSFWIKVGKASCDLGMAKGECVADEQCDGGAECKEAVCMIAPGIAKDLASRVHDHLKRQTEHKSLERARTSRNFQSWLDVGSAVFAWCAAPPDRIRL